MPSIKILAEMPTEILAGLNAGYYVREAAGIIRWAKGTENAGQIVVHLREMIHVGGQIGRPIAPNLLFPMGALMAVQLAGFTYLGVQLSQIRAAISSLQLDVSNILTSLEMIKEHLLLDPLKKVVHGLEHLADAQFKAELLEDARKSFREARAEIGRFLDNLSPVQLIESLPQIDLLLQGLAAAFAGEYICLQKQGVGLDETVHVFTRYSGMMSRVREKLAEAPALHKPPIKKLRYIEKFKHRKELGERLLRTEEAISREREFIKALVEAGPPGRNLEQVGPSEKAIMLFYP